MYEFPTSTRSNSFEIYVNCASSDSGFAGQYKDVDEEFLQRVTENTKRYIGIFAEAVDELMPEPTEAFTVDEDRDILMTQRVDEGADGGADGTDPLQRMPPEIKRFL